MRFTRGPMGRCAAVAGLLLAGAVSCTAPRPPLAVSDPDPAVKIPAIEQAVRDKDLKAAHQLVQDLESDDPAVRFYAIQGLHRLTGQDFGYEFYGDEDQRDAAVKKWQQWLRGEEFATQPATGP